MNIVFTDHAELRIKQNRQRNLTKKNIVDYAKTIPGNIASPIRLNTGRFWIVLRDDCRGNRIIITIIGYVS